MILFYLVFPLVVACTAFYSVMTVIVRPIDPRDRIYHGIMKQWAHVLLFLLRVKVETSGREHIRKEENYIYIANHASYLDIIAICAAVPDDVLFVYKEELTKVPIWGWSLKISPLIMVRRSDPRQAMRSIELAAQEIRERGTSVAVFPEGTRSYDGVLGEFKRGGFLLAARTGVPLVPLAIRGSHLLLPRGEWKVRPGKIEVEIGKPIASKQDMNRNEERVIQEETRVRLEQMLNGKQQAVRQG